MKKFTKDMINDYADRLLIGLTEEEANMVLDEFEIIDKNIDIINKIPNIGDVEAMTHCLDRTIEFLRDDEVEESINIDEILANCDSTQDDQVKVPKVVE